MTETSPAGPLDRPAPTRAYRWIVLAAMSVAVYGTCSGSRVFRPSCRWR